MKKIRLIYSITFLFLFTQIISAQIPSPQSFLGFEIGEAKKLADMHQIIDYFNQLDAASDRIFVQEVGKTTEGNPFIVAYITSVENHQNLEKYRQYQQLLADPRKISIEEAEKMIAEGKAIVMINCSIHATEIGASQMSMKLAYDLATKNDPKTREILDNVILLLIPMHNPDGIQMVVDWYRKYLGTKYESSPMPWLYNTYTGHENNRDWYMFTQIESQLTIKVHNAWHPQIVVDMHQMGSRGARLFVPPYIDPYEPNVDPIIQQQVAMMGTFIAMELTAEGKAGVMHSQGFDAWTPGRAYHHYHGGIRILTEIARVRIASPISIKFEDLPNSVKSPSVSMPLPWKGGDWTLKDIIAYDYSAVKAALTNAARLRKNWLRNFYQIHKKAVNRTDPPFAFIIPSEQQDVPATIKMLQTLQMGLVEIHQAKMDFVVDGQNFPNGAYIIFLAQPYGSYAKALLEKQVYPEIRETPDGPLKMPYDVVAHTLPLLMGVKVVTIDQPFQVDAEKLDKIQKPAGSIADAGNVFGYACGHETNDDIIALNRLLKNNHHVYWAAESFESQGKIYPAGTMIVKNKDDLK
ncbi:MAG TPA: M14 metallopeptidase family protein, partial [bacterium]